MAKLKVNEDLSPSIKQIGQRNNFQGNIPIIVALGQRTEKAPKQISR